jgi:predicted ATPase
VAGLFAREFNVPADKTAPFIEFARGLRSDFSFLTEHLEPAAVFIGRRVELATIARSLNDRSCRLLSLIGSGGCGKSSLAREALRMNQAAYKDGVYFIDLSAVEAASFLASTMMVELGLPVAAGQPALPQLIKGLQSKTLLIGLDNFEQLIDGAPQLSAILSAAPGVKFLVTSRERLRLREEFTLNVEGLPYPEDSESAAESDAVHLFVHMAREANPDFDAASNLAAIVRICRAVDGVPLGLVMAAAQTADSSCESIADALQEGLLLNRPIDGRHERHASLSHVFQQSWKLLDASQQRALRRLAVFRGGFDLEAAHAVAGAGAGLLFQLVDKSLLRRVSADRFDLHMLLRYFLSDLLADSDETAAVNDHHLHYYTALCEKAHHGLRSPDQLIWVNRLTTELGNLRAALTWSQTDPVRAVYGLRLTASILIYWRFELAVEGLYWLEKLLVLADGVDAPAALAQAHLVTGILKFLGGRIADGIVNHEQALMLFDGTGDLAGASLTRAGMIIALGTVGRADEVPGHVARLLVDTPRIPADPDRMVVWVWCANYFLRIGDYAEAQRCLQSAHQCLHAIGSPWYRAQYYYAHGSLNLRLGRHDVALKSLHAAVDDFTLARDRALAGLASHMLGEALIVNGNVADAFNVLGEALRTWEYMGNLAGQGLIYYDLAYAHGSSGSCERALDSLRESLTRYQEARIGAGLPLTLRAAAWLLLTHGLLEPAAQLLGAADAHFVAGEVSSFVMYHAAPREVLAAFAAEFSPELRFHYEAGRALSREAAVERLITLTCPEPALQTA